jgi:hypothetical protein
MTALLIYRIGNMKELEAVYEEFEMGLCKKDWLKLYRHATEEEFGFLFIDMYCKDKRLAMRKGLDTALCYLEMRDRTADEDDAEGPSPKKRKTDEES